MVFRSKLNHTYKTANPADWIIGPWWLLDPEFAGRVAYYCSVKGKKVILTRGYATIEEQQVLYDEYLQYLKTNILGPHRVKLAAKPGLSAHNYRIAGDFNYCEDGKTIHPLFNASNAELKAYGLCKPLISKGEYWHVQPIEANTKSSKVFKSLCPEEIEEDEEEMAETVYKTLDDVPAWGKDTVKKIIAKGGITPTENGTATVNDDEINLTLSMLRIYVSLDKMGKL